MQHDVPFQLPSTSLSSGEILDALRQAIGTAGSAKAFAEEAGLSAAYVGDVLHGRREPADRILAALGLKRITVIAAVEDVR